MSGNIQCIKVDDSKLEALQSKCWCDLELPIVAIPMEYKLKFKDSFTNGFLMVTRGALYVFKSKVFGAPDFVIKYHLLDVRKMRLKTSSVIMEYDDFETEFKSHDIIQAVTAMLTILYEATFGLKSIIILSFSSEIPYTVPIIQQRPKYALKWRALFLAHFYDIKGDQLYTLDYFDKWEDKLTNMIVLGPSFHPGNFAAAYGHALAWESMLDTIVLQGFAPSKFPRMLDALCENASKINRIAFTDYKPKRLPIFNLRNIARTSITKWWFMRSCGKVITDFTEHAVGLPPTMTDFLISSAQLQPDQFTTMVDNFTKSEALKGITHFEFSRTQIKPFPFKDLTRLLKTCNRLETITMRGLEVDATHITKAICQAQSSLKIIHITHMQFRTPLEPAKYTLPSQLVHFDVSSCAFTPASFKSLFQFLTCQPVQIPFILQCQNLVVKPAVYRALSEMDFEACHPTLCEFDFSGNQIPNEPSNYFFAFLFTQKRLRLLTINDIVPEDPTQFMKYVMQLLASLPLSGLDFSGKLPPILVTQFIQALATAPHLRRLGVRNSKSGDQGIAALDGLIRQLPQLNELVADGFGPQTPSALAALWKTVSLHPAIQACDLPTEDLRSLGLTIKKLDQGTQEAFTILHAKARASTTSQRVEFTIASLRENLEIPMTADIFSQTSTMGWTEQNDQIGEHNEDVNQIDD